MNESPFSPLFSYWWPGRWFPGFNSMNNVARNNPVLAPRAYVRVSSRDQNNRCWTAGLKCLCPLELFGTCLLGLQPSRTILSCRKQWLGGPTAPHACQPLILPSNGNNYSWETFLWRSYSHDLYGSQGFLGVDNSARQAIPSPSPKQVCQKPQSSLFRKPSTIPQNLNEDPLFYAPDAAEHREIGNGQF